jgi:uncharacterized protein YjbI with pentapeptide repeats
MRVSQDTQGNSTGTASDRALKDIDLEAKLIEQEHRLVEVMACFFRRKKWADGDPRRYAAKMAVFHWIVIFFFTLAFGGAGGALIAFLGVAIQTTIMLEQTKMMARQNSLLTKQLDDSHEQWIFEYRQTLFKTLYSKEECDLKMTPVTYVLRRTNGAATFEQKLEDPCLMASARTRAEAAVNLYSLEKSRLKSECSNSPLNQTCRPDFSGVDLSFSKLQRKDFSSALFSEGILYRADLSNGRAIDTKFQNANLRSFRLIGVIARRCEFILSPLTKSYFYGGDFESCEFIDSDASEACFKHANLRSAVFSSVNLKDATFDYADLTGAVFDNVRNLDASQLRYACSNGGTQLPFEITLPLCPERIHRPGKIDVDQAVAECSTPKQ